MLGRSAFSTASRVRSRNPGRGGAGRAAFSRRSRVHSSARVPGAGSCAAAKDAPARAARTTEALGRTGLLFVGLAAVQAGQGRVAVLEVPERSHLPVGD